MNNTEVGNNPNEKNSSEEYFDRRKPQQDKEEFAQSPFIDRSAQLRATLNSLAALNAANIVRAKDKYRTKPVDEKFRIPKKVKPIENKEEQKEKQEETKKDKK
ncbi:MAG: hypothetical protein K6A44_04875 [bacterium]|nr:hypothetical protein [bacterium]